MGLRRISATDAIARLAGFAAVIDARSEREFAEAAFGELGLTWLTTSAGDDMVFLLTADQLKL